MLPLALMQLGGKDEGEGSGVVKLVDKIGNWSRVLAIVRQGQATAR